nr:plexin-A2-like [Crassostrea gigas]
MSQNKIVKILRTKTCEQYSENCQQCMDIQNVNCGWCVTQGGCSTYSECTRFASTYWLPSVKNECLSLELTVDLSRHAYKVEGNLLTLMTPLNYDENMTCTLDGSNVSSFLDAEDIYCRIRYTIIFTTRTSSFTTPFEVFIPIFGVVFVLILCVSFFCYKWGVRQGQKGHHENKTTYYQSQYRDSTVENHIYDEPRQPRGQTPVEDRQELTVYENIL